AKSAAKAQEEEIKIFSSTEEGKEESSPKGSAKNEKKSSKEKGSDSSRAKSIEELARENESGPFEIINWGPGEIIPPAVKNAQFYVEFSYPIAAIQALKDGNDIQKEAEKIFQINPKPEGKYIWYGTKMLSYETKEPLTPLTEYTITVGDVKSLGGKSLTGRKTFTTLMSLPEIKRIDIGKKDKSSYFYYDSESGIPFEKAKYARIWFDGYVNKDFASKAIEVEFTDKNQKTEKKDFRIFPVFDKDEWADFSEDNKYTNSYYLEILGNLENEGKLTFKSPENRLQKENDGKKTKEFTFETLKPFTLKLSYPGSRWDDEANAFTFEFTHEIDPKSIAGNVKCGEEIIPEGKIQVSSNCLTIVNPPVEPNKQEIITVSKNIQSIYKTNLTEDYSVFVLGKNKNGYVRFLDSGTKMLEAQFPHKLIFEYMNVTNDSAYKLSSTDNPLYYPSWNERWDRAQKDGKNLTPGEINKNYFEEIDLDPYLKDGKGWVTFEADIGTIQYGSNKSRESSQSNFLNLQVTNLAATARIGINQAVIMVRSLDKNQPVKDAEVRLENLIDRNAFSKSVKTDEKGLAIIDGKDSYRNLFDNYQKASNVVISVSYKGDKIKFKPAGHYTWSYDVYSDQVYEALKIKSRTFMFSDRGIYKPGESVTFRGIDRNQKLGSFIPYQGSYTITFEQNSWRSQNVYGSLYGETAESGGFWGSFNIPEDIEPGNYSIVYKRNDGSQTERLYITVKYFEKRKTQGEIVNTQENLYAGDKISSTIKASYLAGGYLAGEKYSCAWYSQPSYFLPEKKEFSSYEFNPSSRYDYDYEGKSFINSSEGYLSEKGEAQVNCSTQGDTKGQCKIWRLEASVTDESNESLTLVSQKTVHPAFFYAGIGSARDLRGFAKTGKELTFPVILITPEEEILKDKNLVQGAIEYSFTSHYWTYDYQNSINDSIYKRYQKHDDIEYQGSLKADSRTEIKFTPKNAGYYTVRVSAKDKNGRICAAERNFYVTGSNASFYFDDNDAGIKLIPDKNIYRPGETAQILLESPLPQGDYLITTEREGIFTSEVRHLEENTSVLQVPVARNFVPVFYLSVSSYSVRSGEPSHNWGEKDMDKPKGYYGVTEIMVDPMVRAFSIDVQMDKEKYRPGEEATITLTAKKGGKALEGAELTVMAVDRAVLDVIDYHVPDPISEFYSKYNFPLCVTGGDSRYYLMDPVTYSVKNLQG
ncbi:MAG: hypothetical protein K6E78_00235, partial [Treponema sp.]|nr:hypothetical protein [Treponema sp.]